MATLQSTSFTGNPAVFSARRTPNGAGAGRRSLQLSVVAAGGRPVGRAGNVNSRVNRPYRTQRPEEGFNNEHPNAKRAAVMKKKDWHDASGRKGKGYGAYRFTEQYGDINDYSPIYDPTVFSEAGSVYQPGAKGITAWAAIVASILAVGGFLIYSTSTLA